MNIIRLTESKQVTLLCLELKLRATAGHVAIENYYFYVKNDRKFNFEADCID